METILLLILICWVLAWSVFCLLYALGGDMWARLASWGYHAWWAVLLLPALYAVYRVRDYLQGDDIYVPGDHVVYFMQKASVHPGPRAEDVHPALHGDLYRYFVRKPWTVVRVVNDEFVEVVTNGGKRHYIRSDDPNLHKPGVLEKLELRYRWRKDFPRLAA
jgi:hypothetical protein